LPGGADGVECLAEIVRQGVGDGDGLSPGLDPYGPPLVRKLSSHEPQTSSSALHASCEPAIVSQLRLQSSH
jgi:hypothetical protein